MLNRHFELTESTLIQQMSIKVVWFCTSSSNPNEQSSANLDALNFLRALKGERIEGEATIPIAGQNRRLSNSNLDEAIDWFGEMVASYFQRQGLGPPFYLVPIPDTNTTLESTTGPWTSVTAMSIASKFEGDVETLDVLRWKKNLSHLSAEAQDSTRLYENLALLGKIEWDKPIVLVDYLAANAARAQACEAFLRANGAPVLLCVFAGRIVSQKPEKNFAVFRAEFAGINPVPLRSAD